MEDWQVIQEIYDNTSKEEEIDGITCAFYSWMTEDGQGVETEEHLNEVLTFLRSKLSYTEPRRLRGFFSTYVPLNDKLKVDRDFKQAYIEVFLVHHGNGLYTLNPIGELYIEKQLEMYHVWLNDEEFSYEQSYSEFEFELFIDDLIKQEIYDRSNSSSCLHI